MRINLFKTENSGVSHDVAICDSLIVSNHDVVHVNVKVIHKYRSVCIRNDKIFFEHTKICVFKFKFS